MVYKQLVENGFNTHYTIFTDLKLVQKLNITLKKVCIGDKRHKRQLLTQNLGMVYYRTNLSKLV